jgi:transglutaminase-like putative cysteine protease
MRYRIRHVTTLRYDGVVRLARLNLRLKPAPWSSQSLLDFQLDITPRPFSSEQGAGPWIVNRHRLAFSEPLSRLIIATQMEVEVSPPSFALEMAVSPSLGDLRKAALSSRDLSALSPASYLYASAMAADSAEIARWAAQFFAPDAPVLPQASALMAAIFDEFAYDGTATEVSTPAITAFHQRRGVCQDFAHIMIIAARSAGIPAAYVSGYLRTIPPAGQPRLVGADAMHAWVALWCGPALGWIGFDPTNNLLAGSDHIFTAMGRDYADVAPIDGVFLGGAGQKIETSVDVEPQV